LEVGVLSPVRREPIKKNWVPLVVANFQELTLIRLLEEQKQCSPSYFVEGDPQLGAQAFGLKEVQKDLHQRQMAEIGTKNGKSPDKCPTIWM